MAVLKPARREFYAQNLAKGMSQATAYEAAGYKPNRQNAHALAVEPAIINRVAELMARKVDKVILSKNYVLDGTIENFEKAIGRKPVKITKMVKVEDRYEQQIVEVFVYEPQAANVALKMLGSEVGMFTDKRELKITNEYSGMTDRELAQKLVEIGQAALLEGPVIEHEEAETVEEGEDDAG